MTDDGDYDRNMKRTQDALIFAVGITGSINELWIVRDPRPHAIAFLISLLGLPFIRRLDDLRRSNNGEKSKGNDS